MAAPELDRDPLEFTKDGSPKNRIEMEDELRQKRKKVYSLRTLAIYEYGLDKTKAFDMTEAVLRHWVLDEMIRRGLIAGDLAGVNVQTYNDDNEQRQFIQRLTALIQTGQAVTPKTGEGIEIDMSNVPQPPGPPGYPTPNGQNQPGAFVPPPPPGMAPPQQGFAPPGPPQGGFQPPAPGGFQPPGPPQGAPQFAPQPGPQQGFAPPPGPPGPPQQQQQLAPQQGFAPPGVSPQQMPPQPMMPPGYAAPPGPPQGMPPGPPAGPPQGQQQAAGGNRRRGGGKAAGQQAAPPPATPVPPMGAAPGFAPPPGPPQGQAPMPQQGGFPMPQQGFAPPPQQQGFAPQQPQQAPAADTSALQAQVGELRGIILSLQRQVTIGNMALTILSRAVYQKQGSADIEVWLKELGVSVPQ